LPSHRVKQGECLTSIAARYGFADWRAIYQHPSNAELRKKRPNPSLLFPGDVLFVPEKRRKTVTAQTGKELKLEVNLPPRKVQLDLLQDDGAPLAGVAWWIEGDGVELSGTTSAAGRVEALVPAWLRSALLRAGEREYRLEIGALDPLKDVPDGGVSGLRARLRNLGYEPGPNEPRMTPRTRLALASFQREHGLPGTGELDQETLRKLEEVHGC
jgi:N-acetylmuramoyl-L-alanine amidase